MGKPIVFAGLWFMGLTVLLCLTGCSRQAEPELAVGDSTPYELSGGDLYADDQYKSVRVGMDGFVGANDEVQEILRHKLGIILVPMDTAGWSEADMETAAASGVLPDILRVDIGKGYLSRWIVEGIIRDIPPEMLKNFPVLSNSLEASAELKAYKQLYGAKNWFLPVGDILSKADGGRIYYRTDWVAELGLEMPDTIDDFKEMLDAFKSAGKPGLTAVGGVTYILSLFGTDPESWVLESDEWVPAYYSDRMLPGLLYVRALFEAGYLDKEYPITKANAAVNKLSLDGAGALVRYGDVYWMNRVLSAFGDAHGVESHEVLSDYVQIMPPPAVSSAVGDEQRFWARHVVTEGCVINAGVGDETLERILEFLTYSLSEEGKHLAYFGLRGVTYALDKSGTPRLFIDPSTGQPIDIVSRYPTVRGLFLMHDGQSGALTASVPSDVHPAIKRACAEYAAIYDKSAIDEGDGFAARFLSTPAKDELALFFDYNAAFNRIVTGTAPVEEMFLRFKEECDEKGIRQAIAEVTARMAELGLMSGSAS